MIGIVFVQADRLAGADDATHRRDIPYRSATVNQRYGHAAAAHNTKVGPRPTVQDLRTGKHTIKPVSTTSTRNITTRSGRTITRATTGRTAVGATGNRTRSTATGTSTRKAGTGPGATGGKSHAKPKGVAHGVRGTDASRAPRHEATPVNPPMAEEMQLTPIKKRRLMPLPKRTRID